MAPRRNLQQRAPGSREEDAWLSDEQLAQCTPADETDAYGLPIPTQIVSNGEYMPPPQTETQRRVEARTLELADSAAKEAWPQPPSVLSGNGRYGGGPPGHERSIRPIFRREAYRDVLVGRVGGHRRPDGPV